MLSITLRIAAVASVIAAAGSLAGWKATLVPTEGSTVSGEATVRPAEKAKTDTTMRSEGMLTADIGVRGARSGEALPWHVHSGSCAAKDAPIVGPASDYPTITIGESGEGKASAHVMGKLEPSGQYIVNVHRSATDLTVVSCGALKADMVSGQ
ncbi:MAG: hypothetical protein ACT4P7_20460 [Gemmatimonadaceae bacterium]